MNFWEMLKSKISPRRVQDHYEGEEAAAKARAQLKQVQARTPEVNRVASSLRDLRERNHFGEAVEEAMLRRVRS